MNEFPIADKIGVTKKAIKKAISGGIKEETLLNFIHGDINNIYNSLPEPSGLQSWETSGKRYVHLEEARFVARHFLRNAVKPPTTALVLSGMDPALACLPWAMSGVATKFVAYEKDSMVYSLAWGRLGHELRKIQSRSLEHKLCTLNILSGDILKEKRLGFGVIDLDFCNNQLRTKDSREQIINLLDRVSPMKEPFVFRTTLHLGRVNNSLQDVENHIEKFEEELRIGEDGYQSYRIRAFDRSPYQSSLPMVSLVWILERKTNENITNQQKGER